MYNNYYNNNFNNISHSIKSVHSIVFCSTRKTDGKNRLQKVLGYLQTMKKKNCTQAISY